MATNVWTRGEVTRLVAAFRGGFKPEHIAQSLRKTPASVRRKLSQLRLTGHGCDPGVAPKRHRNDERLALRRADLAFQSAMMKAIKDGAERARPGVNKSVTARYTPHVRPAIDSGYRSSAGYAADMGERRDGPP